MFGVSRMYESLNMFYSFTAMILGVTAIKLINSSQALLVFYSLLDSYEKGEGRGQLDSAAEFLVAPVKTAQPLSQVSPASTLQSILQHFSLIRLNPRPLIPVGYDNLRFCSFLIIMYISNIRILFE